MSAIKMHNIKMIHLESYSDTAYSEEQLEFLFSCVSSEHSEPIYVAALLAFTEASDLELDYLLDRYELLLQQARYLVIPMLVCVDYVRVFIFCLKRLEVSRDQVEVHILIQSLGVSDFLMMPLIVDLLITDKMVFLNRLKQLLAEIGFKKAHAYLGVLPQLPHEAIFREVYGDDCIDQIKH